MCPQRQRSLIGMRPTIAAEATKKLSSGANWQKEDAASPQVHPSPRSFDRAVMSAASMTHCRPGITGKLLLILVTVPGGPAGRPYGWEWGAYGPSQAAHRDHRDVPAQAADLES